MKVFLFLKLRKKKLLTKRAQILRSWSMTLKRFPMIKLWKNKEIQDACWEIKVIDLSCNASFNWKWSLITSKNLNKIITSCLNKALRTILNSTWARARLEKLKLKKLVNGTYQGAKKFIITSTRLSLNQAQSQKMIWDPW